MNPIVLIPARLAASRLPGKPLADIAGTPMVVHVLRRAQEADIGSVAVACGDAAIARAVQDAGGTAVMTDPDLPSGSDRVHAALQVLDPDGAHDVVVNLQGDLPTIAPTDMHSALDALDGHDIGTLVCPADAAEAANPAIVKAVCAFAPGRTTATALYFSRAAVPAGNGPFWHHLGIYAWRRAALARFVALPQSELERRERLEQLRALEAGMRIGCAQVTAAPFGVDTPADLDRVRALFA